VSGGGDAWRPFGRGWRFWAWVLAVSVAVVAARFPGAASDLRNAFAHPGELRLGWLGPAGAAEAVALACGVAVQRQLLADGNIRLPSSALFVLVLASTGLARVMPAGSVTGAAWQAAQYRRRGLGAAVGVWAVMAAGFTSVIAIVGLLLAGAAVATVGRLWLLGCAAGLLVAGIAMLTVLRHGAGALGRMLNRHGDRSPVIARLAEAMAELPTQRTGVRLGAGVLAFAAAGVMADACVLASCFALAGLPVPWRSLLFAYAAGQLAGRFVPLPGGLGAMEGGVLGGLMLTGTSPSAAAAAVIAYRVAGYWAVGAAGTTVAIAVTRRSPQNGTPAAPGAATADAKEQTAPGDGAAAIGAGVDPASCGAAWRAGPARSARQAGPARDRMGVMPPMPERHR
jgi:putative heme transporter